jgi:hypothetical protein
MLYFSLFLIELLLLFLLSKSLTNQLFAFFYQTTRSKKISIYLLSILFLPGTIIHEISHALMAAILQVRVGRMEFIPKLVGNNLKMGSVEVGHSDPIRRILIGTAPFLFGVSILIGTFFYAIQNDLLTNKLYVIVISYIVFEIGNTMFSSRKDLEGALGVTLAFMLISVIFYLIDFRLPALSPSIIFSNPIIKEVLQKACIYLLFPIGIDIILISILKLLKR